MATKSKKEEKILNSPSMLGFLVGLGAWVTIFVFIALLYALQKESIPFLEKSLATPLKYFMRGFWDSLLGVKSLSEITRPMEVGVFVAAALMWGVLGALIGYLIEKIILKKKGEEK